MSEEYHEARPGPVNRPQVLVADDDPRARAVVEALLSADGYALTFVNDGQQALEELGRSSPDLVLLDVLMPGLDGFEVCRRVRSLRSGAEVPILLVTSLDDRRSRLAGLEAGADDFITKPFDSLELRTRVRAITRLNRYRRLVGERERLWWLLDRDADGYVLVNEEGEVVYANRAARGYLDLAGGDSRASFGNFLALVDRLYARHPREGWDGWPGVEELPVPRLLVRSATANDPALWLQVNLSAGIAGGGQPVVVRLHDVSETILAHRDTLRLRDMVSHKLRTSLNHMLGPAQLLELGAESLSRSEIRELAAIAYRGTVGLCEQIDSILRDWDRPLWSFLPGDGFQLGDLPEKVQEVARSLSLPSARVDIPDELRTGALALTTSGMTNVLGELLRNASKFHPQGRPNVSVEVRRVDASDGDKVAIRFVDDGVHMSQAALLRARTPFFQAGKTGTEVSGMGLGLTDVACTVWSVGGDLEVYNRADGVGVVVELVVPYVSNEKPVAATPG